MTKGAEILTVTDPAVIYDMMIDARTRLIGRYLALHSGEERVAFVLDQNSRTAAVEVDDIHALRLLTATLEAEYRALTA